MKPRLRIGQSVPAIASGQWQLHWYGQMASAPQAAITPFVYAFFHRVERLASGGLRHHKDSRRVLLPITDTPAFPIGTVVCDGYVNEAEALSPHFTWDDITINFSRDNIQVFSRLGLESHGNRGLLDEPFLMHPGRNTVATDRRYNSLLLKVGGCDGDGSLPYVFPCWAIFRFFWAPTSKWAQLMVDGRFADSEHYLFNLARSRLSADGHSAMLWLRQWMKDEDVPFLASIAFDSYAMNRGADIYRYLAQGSRARGPHFVRALPPFEGQMPLNVLRRRVQTDTSDFWLVQLIRSCGYQSSIQEISFDRDNDGRTLDEALAGTDPEKRPMERRKLHSVPPASVIEISHLPRRSSSGDTDVDVDQKGTRFPNLNAIPCDKLPQTDTVYKSVAQAVQRLNMWERQVSSLGDSASARELAAGANLQTQRHQEHLNTDSGRQTLGDVSLIASALLGASGDTIEIGGEKYLVEIEALFPGEQEGDYFLVPLEPSGGRQPAWRYVDKERRQRKRGLCLRIVFKVEGDERAVRYLFDFEPRNDKQNSILLLWRPDERALHDEQETLSLLAWNICRNESTALPADQLFGLCSRTRKHTSSEATLLLSDIYSAVDRFE
ncbi:MAG: hypothetical protein Q8S71_04570 [Hydrogenophaga sp.]|nr:hypothetical protein [Hydrogenophaga sp.]MDP3322803.1 hypothetical protein [Hydrogenophaga sp.]